MKAVFVLFDSLNRHALSCYGPQAGGSSFQDHAVDPGAGAAADMLANASVRTPAFRRLAERSVVFDRHFVGSLPCMPARRDIQTGRLNFLHRGWGPLEPFDASIAEILGERGVYTHLITDHYHYFEDGGSGFMAGMPRGISSGVRRRTSGDRGSARPSTATPRGSTNASMISGWTRTASCRTTSTATTWRSRGCSR